MKRKCVEWLKDGTQCGGTIYIHPDKEITGWNKILCKNRKCPRYYKCSCGKIYGTHYYEYKLKIDIKK